MYGKCWIYKRAILYQNEQPPKLLDYTNGTKSFICKDVIKNNDNLFYRWRLKEYPIFNMNIPLNISSMAPYSFFKRGIINLPNGNIYWEYLFGRYEEINDTYIKCIIILFVVLLLVLLYYIIKK